MKQIQTQIKNLAAAAILFLLPLNVSAQKDAEAKKYLDKSADVFSKAEALSIHFTMNIHYVPDKTSESFDGTLDLKGTKYHLDTPENEIWFNGQTQWVLQKAYGEVQVSEPSEQETQLLNPSVIFNLYKKDCNYKYRGEKTDGKGRRTHELELIPQAKESEISRIMVQIGANDSQLWKIHVFYRNEMENLIYISNYQTNTAPVDSSFVFNPKKYPDAEIIDLR
jgi:outer membrane lipoprotein-sorting protein